MRSAVPAGVLFLGLMSKITLPSAAVALRSIFSQGESLLASLPQGQVIPILNEQGQGTTYQLMTPQYEGESGVGSAAFLRHMDGQLEFAELDGENWQAVEGGADFLRLLAGITRHDGNLVCVVFNLRA